MSAGHQVSEQTAKLFAKEWIDGQMPPMPKKTYIRSERRALIDQMAEKCIQQTLRQRGSLDDLENQLSQIFEIVNAIWYASATQETKQWMWPDPAAQTSDDDKELVAQHKLWWRRDPHQSYREGFESKNHFNCDKEEVKFAAALYLEKEWLRIPKVDWIFIDILITRELCAYGESLKEMYISGKKSNHLNINNKYYEVKGNLQEMTKDRWKEQLKSSVWKTTYAFLLPVGSISTAFLLNRDKLGYAILGIYGLIILDILVASIRRSSYLRKGNPDAKLVPFRIWDNMYIVWQRLQGPIVNPARIKEILEESAKMGAVWDETIWAIIGRVVKIDADVWVIQASSES